MLGLTARKDHPLKKAVYSNDSDHSAHPLALPAQCVAMNLEHSITAELTLRLDGPNREEDTLYFSLS